MVQLDERCQQVGHGSDLGVLEDLSIIGVKGHATLHHRGFHSIYGALPPAVVLKDISSPDAYETEHLPSSVLRTFIHSLAYQYLLATPYASTLRLSNDGALTYR